MMCQLLIGGTEVGTGIWDRRFSPQSECWKNAEVNMYDEKERSYYYNLRLDFLQCQ